MSASSSTRRALSYDAFTECWYVPGETHLVDLIHPDDGLTLHYSENAEQIRGRYPNAERMACEEAWRQIEGAARARYRSDIVEISAERFMDALNVLPPVGWTTKTGVESFKISERIWGNITDIYARLGERYFKLADDIRLPADIIADRIAAFAASNPMPASPHEPVRPSDPTPISSRPYAPAPEGDQ